MDSYRAVGLAEGWIHTEDEYEVINAWQYLHDTKLAYKLQGWFGRTARNLLDAGVITDTNEQNDKLIERMRKASDW
tara:strand:- start:323 stop:550 length:228 start_codon:yes stop_codon:yes gene_type:complete